MAFERKVQPAAYLIGSAHNATLTVRFRDVNGKRRSLRVIGVGSYRLREDGSLFSVRSAERAGARNLLSISYGPGDSATIRNGQGNRLSVSDVSLTLAEGGYTVVVA